METAVLSTTRCFVRRALRKSMSSFCPPLAGAGSFGQQGHGWSCQCCTGGTAQWDISTSDSGKLLEDAMGAYGEYTLDVALCLASKKDSCELPLPESHISWVTCSSHKSCEHCWNSGHHYLILTRDALYDGLFSLTDLHGSGNKKETESFLIRQD